MGHRSEGSLLGHIGRQVTHYMLTNDRPLFHQPSVTCCLFPETVEGGGCVGT